MCVISGSLGSCSRPLALWTLHSLQSWNLDAPTLAKALVSWWVIPFHDISLEPTPVEWAWNMSWGGACLPGMAWGALHVYFPSRGDHLHPFPLPPKCPDTETFQHAVFFWQGYTFFLKKLLATELVTWLEFLKICFFPFSWMLLPDATSIFSSERRWVEPMFWALFGGRASPSHLTWVFNNSGRVSHIIQAAAAPSDDFCSCICCAMIPLFHGSAATLIDHLLVVHVSPAPLHLCSHQAQSRQSDPVPGLWLSWRSLCPAWPGFVSILPVFLLMLCLPFLQSAVLGNLSP